MNIIIDSVSHIMRKHSRILLSFVLAVCVATWGNPDLRPFINPLNTEFTGLLVLRWPATHCMHLKQRGIQCSNKTLSLWDSLSFTIGGMWPSSKTKKSYHSFNINYVEQDLSITDRLHNFWPKLHHDNIMLSQEMEAHTLWKEEWDKHGVHYANILQTLFPDQYEFEQKLLQKTFFEDAILQYQRKFYNAQKLGKSTIFHPQDDLIMQKHEFSNLLFLEDNNFIMKCLDNSNILYEIRICLSFSQDGIFPTQCKKVQEESNMKVMDNCPKEVKLVGYGSKKEQNIGGRVFVYHQEPIHNEDDLSAVGWADGTDNIDKNFDEPADL